MSDSFVHLNVHSCFSMLSGAARVEDMIERAKRLGFDALALTDTNGLYGAVPFVRKARELGIKPILGAEVVHGRDRAICLARDRTGYANLCRIITTRQLDVDFDLADSITESHEGLFVLARGPALLDRLDKHLEHGALFREVWNPSELSASDNIPPVITNHVHFAHPQQHDIHRVLTAIRKNKPVVNVTNAELAPPGAWLKSGADMTAAFSHTADGREALLNTRRIADACHVEIESTRPIFPKASFTATDSEPSPVALLRSLVLRGTGKRYPGTKLSSEVRNRLDYELSVIEKLGFAEYFLIVWDIVRFAHRKDIPTVGRGSAANSMAAYCLGITSVDPLAYDLYFERFLNLSRTDCPDIDIDLCWRRREEVIRYVYERYGADRVAMVSNHNTFQARSAFRDVARVSGLSMTEINRLSAMLPHYSATSIRDAMKLFPESRSFPIDKEPCRTITAFAEAIDGFPRHLSVHVGGIVIGDRPLTHYVPLERSTNGRVITQYEKDGVEAIGLVKIDLLGHRSLTVVRDAVNAVKRNHGVEIDLQQLPDDDARTAAVLSEGKTIGCFQIESPGMRSLLRMLGAKNRLDAIHALSLIRPGPSASGMKKRFIRRRLGEEETTYPDPRLEKVLADTHGVMLFQEDVLKVAEAVAGFSLEQGDGLRKAMSKERSPKRMAMLRDRFMHGAAQRSVRLGAAREIWEQIGNFAGYSYCKAHAVTYGYIAYQATYLKAHYPAEFLAAVMSNHGGFYETREYLEEARRLGVRILPPDVNCSAIEHTSGRESIRIGLGQVKGLTQRAMRSILHARAQREFTGLEDFYFRTQVNNGETEKLILCGALDSACHERTRPQMLWELRLLSQEVCKAGDMIREETAMFGDIETANRTPPTSREAIPSLPEYSVEKRIRLEQEILDLAVTDHPLSVYEEALSNPELVKSNYLDRHVGQSVTVAGWLVTARRAMTKNHETMKFMTIEDRFGTMEVTLFPETYRNYGARIRSYGPYLVRGRVERNHRAIGITAEWVGSMPEE